LGRGVARRGLSTHLVWFDEEPPSDVYVEALVRTMTTNGHVLLTFTPLEGMSEVEQMCVADACLRNQATEPRKHQAIDVSDGNPLGRSPPQHIELMAKDENFGLQRCARPQQPGHCVPGQPEEITHRGTIINRFADDRQLFWV
jgi:phage terminase large subunit-like protein